MNVKEDNTYPIIAQKNLSSMTVKEDNTNLIAVNTYPYKERLRRY